MEQDVGGENSPSQFINNDLRIVPFDENGPSHPITMVAVPPLLTYRRVLLPTMVPAMQIL
jgi:hypothetical protein